VSRAGFFGSVSGAAVEVVGLGLAVAEDVGLEVAARSHALGRHAACKQFRVVAKPAVAKVGPPSHLIGGSVVSSMQGKKKKRKRCREENQKTEVGKQG
jgi:hypothetical protein